MKKVAFVIGIMGNGGAERVISALANEWAQMGIEIKIITIFGNRQDYSLSKGVQTVPIICGNKNRILRPLERLKTIKNTIVEFDPDCVISFLTDVNIHTIFACRGLKIPLIVSERNDPKNAPKQKWMRKLRDLVYKKAQGIVFQTEEAAQYFRPYLKADNMQTIISNPLTPNLPYYVHDETNTRIITACRLNVQKNLPLMIDAIVELKEEGLALTLDIFGEGPLKESLQNYIAEKQATEFINLKGFSKDIHSEMVNSACFVISSDYEGISNSMLEALAIGVPVVATDCPVGGARMFIKNGINGYLVPVGDKEAMKTAIKSVMNNREEARVMGEKATALRDTLNVKTITKQWSDFINLVITERR